MYVLKLHNAIILHYADQKSFQRKGTGTSYQTMKRNLKNLLAKIFTEQEMCFYPKEGNKKEEVKH